MTHYSDPARDLHLARVVAESFGSDAQRYERARPGYPVAMVIRLVDAIPGREVVSKRAARSVCACWRGDGLV
jgi:hypothetical protein